MIYLSKLNLNVQSRQVQAELNNPYEMHRTLSKAFAGKDDQLAEARCLFRVEEGRLPSDLHILVQARMLPEWSKLTVAPNYLRDAPITKEIAPRFVAGQHLAFRLRANPTIKRDGKRWGLEKEETRVDWLYRKAESSGFQICSVIARPQDKVTCWTSERQLATFSAVTFEGVLCVTDPQALLAALESGIGAAKGLGFGLLSLARA